MRRRINNKQGREIYSGLHQIARDLQDEIDMLPVGSVGAKRLERLRTAIILDVGAHLATRYPLSEEGS